jgi:hypothetical protein
MSINIFEQASKLKLRFASQKGLLSVEDLWDLPLTSDKGASLNGVAKAANKEANDSAEEDFVSVAKTANTEATLKLEVAKHIIAIRMEEADARKKAAENKAKKETILAAIANKQNEQINSASLEDLNKMLESL